jgi:regulator of cell morphogenesis and NO signaling
VPVSELSDQELIDLILTVHHVPERVLWKELDELVNKILLVHFNHDPARLLELHRCFSLLKMELEQHFAKEEKVLFPALRLETKSEADINQIKTLIAELESEHDAAGQLIKQIIALTDHFTPPDYACPTFKVVYAKLHELVDDVFLHIAKENSVLFKRYAS